MNRFRIPLLLTILTASLLAFAACSGDDDPVQPKPEPDYFPFSRAYTWTYRTNVYANMGMPEATVQMNIDTISTKNGVFNWMWLRIPGHFDWEPMIALLDSANVIYSIGDNPPEETFPLFKHKYAASEVTSETITVQGKAYNTLRYDFNFQGIGTVSWWFADGIGLVKEYSEDGLTIFAADMIEGTALTELTAYSK